MESGFIQFDMRKCQECGKELKGRIDKRFCDMSCKSSYHNRHKSPGEETISNFNRILRHNRTILKTLCPQGKSTVRKEVLDHMKYDYRFFTNLFRSNKGALYYLCYDYGFTRIVERGIDKIVIIQRQDYMDRYDPITHLT